MAGEGWGTRGRPASRLNGNGRCPRISRVWHCVSAGKKEIERREPDWIHTNARSRHLSVYLFIANVRKPSPSPPASLDIGDDTKTVMGLVFRGKLQVPLPLQLLLVLVFLLLGASTDDRMLLGDTRRAGRWEEYFGAQSRRYAGARYDVAVVLSGVWWTPSLPRLMIMDLAGWSLTRRLLITFRKGLSRSIRLIWEWEVACWAVASVPNRPGGRWGPAGRLPRAPDGTGGLAVVRPVRPKGRTAVLGGTAGPTGWDMLVQGRGNRRPGTVGDGQAWVRTAGACGGQPGTERVMSHDAIMIRSDIYEINCSQYLWQRIHWRLLHVYRIGQG